MQPVNLQKVQESFSVQATEFENKKMNFSKKEYLDYTIRQIQAKNSDTVLEVASGTCACGRAIAPLVTKVVCLDATPAMLEVAQNLAREEKLGNMEFVNGYVETLPFEAETFDIVMTRLSFHHFTEMQAPFSEMHRVLKKGGKLVIIDMEATDEELRELEDRIETLRDCSHVKNRSKAELEGLFKAASCDIIVSESTKIPVQLQAWMDLTKTASHTQEKIRTVMLEEIKGGKKTGFYPYMKENEIYFDQRWLMVIGIRGEMTGELSPRSRIGFGEEMK